MKGFSYAINKDTVFDLKEEDLVISAYQPNSVLLQVLFEPDHRLNDSLTYDITAWALPYAFGLEAYALKQRIEPRNEYQPYIAPHVRSTTPPYAWCVRWRSPADARFLARLLERGVRVRYAMQSFSLADQSFEAGTLVINRADNQNLSAELDGLVSEAAQATNVAIHPVFSGWATKGHDLGSDNFVIIERPEVAIVYGGEVDDNAYGHLWYLFERDLDYPLTPIALDRLSRVRLSDYTTLIFPHGSYTLSESTIKTLREWIRQGGRLIAIEGGLRAFADKEGFDLKTRADSKKDTVSSDLFKPYQHRERDRLSEQALGAIVQAEVDPTHPLTFGLRGRYFSLKNSSYCYDIGSNAQAPVRLGNTVSYRGFIGSRLLPRLKNTPIVATQHLGEGKVIFFVDDPVFRGFWEQGKMLLYNALFF